MEIRRLLSRNLWGGEMGDSETLKGPRTLPLDLKKSHQR